MDLEIYRVYRDASGSGTAELVGLSPSVFWDGKHCVFVARTCGARELAAAFAGHGEAIRRMGAQKLHFESADAVGALEGLRESHEAGVYDRIVLRRTPGTPRPDREPGTVDAAEAMRGGALRNLEPLLAEIAETSTRGSSSGRASGPAPRIMGRSRAGAYRNIMPRASAGSGSRPSGNSGGGAWPRARHAPSGASATSAASRRTGTAGCRTRAR